MKLKEKAEEYATPYKCGPGLETCKHDVKAAYLAGYREALKDAADAVKEWTIEDPHEIVGTILALGEEA